MTTFVSTAATNLNRFKGLEVPLAELRQHNICKTALEACNWCLPPAGPLRYRGLSLIDERIAVRASRMGPA
jgi:hypothetical protein